MPLQGNLQEMSLANLIQVNCQEMRSARLVLTRANQSGEIYFSDGQVVHATLGEQRGEAAVYALLQWDDGTFVLHLEQPTPEKTVTTSWRTLLLEGMKRVVEPPATTPRVDSPVFAELEDAWRQLVTEAEKSKTTLRALDSLAVWLSCPHTRALLTPPSKKQLEFAARSAQRESIRRVFERAGHQTTQAIEEFFASPRLRFTNLARGLFTEVHLDKFAMYHQLELTPFLAQEGAVLPETALILLRLQLVEMPKAALRELGALLLECDISPVAAKGKIDASAIARLCADDWGWYRTVTMNLQRVMAFAVTTITTDDKAIVVERAEQIRQAIESAPKSIRWQARARLGDNVRWYELPTTPGSEQPPLEIRYGD
jgi:hypothetical protein